MRIFLIGFMGCGKTTVGKTIARKLDFEFVDTDSIIEELFKTNVNEYFRILGEQRFRETERKALDEIINHDNIVVSTGGGLPCYNNNIEVMNNHGLTIYLKMSVSSLHHRLLQSKKKRPLLENMNSAELKSFIEVKLAERETYYNQAKLILPGENFDYQNLLLKLDNL